ncbi:hypothetical protein Pfo_012686 [Paulownia fortunei]|nr:hypothetical protein Pfo_012686 [Paulownia fortunei]
MLLIHFFLVTKKAMTGVIRNSNTSVDSFEGIQYAASISSGDSFFQNSNLQLTVHKLNGKNYLEWAQSVKLAIDGRGKLGHLIGEVAQPAANDPSLKKRRSENSLIMAWHINSMEPTIGKPHLFLPTAKDVWEVVRDFYSDLENSPQIFDLKTQLWQSKQGEREVTIYYNELVTLWQELDQCYDDDWENPNDCARHKKREKNDRLYMFLAGLHRNLDEVRG